MHRKPFHHPLLLAALLTACAGGTVSAQWVAYLVEVGEARGERSASEPGSGESDGTGEPGGMSAPISAALWHARVLGSDHGLRELTPSLGTGGPGMRHLDLAASHRQHASLRLAKQQRLVSRMPRRLRRRHLPYARRSGRSSSASDDEDRLRRGAA